MESNKSIFDAINDANEGSEIVIDAGVYPEITPSCCDPNCGCHADTESDARIPVTNIEHCARCGGTHQQIWFFRFTYPIQDSDGTKWTHWAVCPTNGEPILANMMEAASDDS